MKTNLRHGKAVTDAAADALTKELLDGRDLLPPAANNRAPLPRNRTLAYTRAAMRAGTCKPFHHLLASAKADLEDGVPFAVVIAPFRQLATEIEVMAVQEHERRHERPVPALMDRTLKETGELAAVMLKLARSPESPDLLVALLREARDCPPVLAELTAAAGRTLAVVRAGGSSPRVYGARRPALEIAQ